jgi:diguanylate cyclase (GGDEF)-like protein
MRLLTSATRDGEAGTRDDLVAELRQKAGTTITVGQLFGLIHLVERAALDELAVDDSFGATSEPWPVLAQLVRRSSYDVLAAYAERINREPGSDALTDQLTTLHTKAVLETATEKEVQRIRRFGHPFALILIDVDRLGDINARHGLGSGDRVLERLGILIRNYFREQDWVGRCGGGAFAVLLPETQRQHAVLLGERLRTTVEGRMSLHDYRSEEEFPVTVSVAVVWVESVDPTTRAEQLFEQAQRAMQRAKLAGRNCVETAEISGRLPTPNPLR